MQLLMKEVFSGPTSFFALASLMQAVRLACLAASLEGGGAGVAAAAGGASPRGVGASANPTDRAKRPRHSAAATIDNWAFIPSRIAPAPDPSDDARMKLA
jgi:hypothetical protein